MRRTTLCRYTTNPKTVARVNASKVVTDTAGANCFADATEARLLTRMSREKTKVARNKPSVRRVTRERMKIRTVLGEYWLAASWMATSCGGEHRELDNGGGEYGLALYRRTRRDLS
jgi:hypothetical protein